MSHSSPRIVSLLPSATEILCAIGAEHLLVGRSHECDFPASIAHLPVLTSPRTAFESSAQIDRDVREQLTTGQSLYTLNTDLLASLRPDVIVTQDLCAVCSIDLNTVRRLAERLDPVPVIVSLNPMTLEAVLDDHLTVGAAIGMEPQAAETVAHLRDRLYRAQELVTPFLDGPNVAFLEWTDPLFIAGHWTPQLIERAGARHPLNATVPIPEAGAAEGPIGQTLRVAGKSIAVPPDILVASRPDILLICPCGLSLDRALHETSLLAQKPWWNGLPAVLSNRVAIIDGNQMFNRPGPRLVDAFEFLVGYLNDRPEVIPADFPWRRL